MSDLLVRTARSSDAGSVLDVKRAAIGELASRAYTPVELAAWAPEEDAIDEYRTAMTADAFQVLVAEDGDRIAGYGVLNPSDSRVEALFVRPFWTRSGVATRLLSQLEVSAAFAGCGRLSVVSSLNAVPFYDSMGYARIGDRNRTIDGVDIEFMLLQKDLPVEDGAADSYRPQ